MLMMALMMNAMGGAAAAAKQTIASRGQLPRLLLPRDRELQGRLDRLHLLAGVLALGLGGLAAGVLAASLTGPLRRLTVSARRIELGRLGERAPVGGGGAEVQQLAGALNRLAETLERADQLRRDSVADLAHELRTPATGILSRVEAAQDGVLPDDRANLDAITTRLGGSRR